MNRGTAAVKRAGARRFPAQPHLWKFPFPLGVGFRHQREVLPKFASIAGKVYIVQAMNERDKEKIVFRPDDVAHLLGVHRRTVARMVTRGELPQPCRFSSKVLGWWCDDISIWLDDHRIRAIKSAAPIEGGSAANGAIRAGYCVRCSPHACITFRRSPSRSVCM